jgi:hypothetical protein
MRFPPLSLLILLVLAVTRLTAALPVPITPVEGRAGMVVAGHPEAAEAGLAVLRAGGNAIDAAIATSLAVGVAEPYGSGLGGKLMFLYHEARSGRTYAIDAMTGTLVLQGSRAGEKPLVPADTGRLRTIGTLGLGSAERVGFDIAEQTGAAFVSVTRPGGSRSTFHLLDLSTGKATFIGTIGGGEAVRGIATVP